MYIVASNSRRISSVSGSFDCFDWLPKKMQDSRSEWKRIFPTRPYICRPWAAGVGRDNDSPRLLTGWSVSCKEG